MLKSLSYLQLKIWLSFLISQSDKRGLQNIPGLLSTIAVACKPAFEVLSMDQINRTGK